MVTLYSLAGSESEYEEMSTVAASPENCAFDLSKVAGKPLRFDHSYWLRIQETAGERAVLFDKAFALNMKTDEADFENDRVAHPGQDSAITVGQRRERADDELTGRRPTRRCLLAR